MPAKRLYYTIEGNGVGDNLALLAVGAPELLGASEPALRSRPGRSGRNVRRKKDDLPKKGIYGIPSEIFLDICGHLEPRDLVILAKTSKLFWKPLRGPELSPSIWKAARANIRGLPDCPPDLSELGYANLAFFAHCHGCFKSNVRNVLWDFRVRYCPDCRKENTYDDRRTLERIIVPPRLRSKVDATQLVTSMRVNRKTLFLKSEIDEVEASLQSLSDSPDEEEQYINERVVHVKMITEHSDACSGWVDWIASSRGNELAVLRDGRLQVALTNLRKQGWDAELELMEQTGYQQLKRHRHMRVPKVLTERGWNKIKDELVLFMLETKTDRLMRERSDVVQTRIGVLLKLINRFYDELYPQPDPEKLLNPLLSDFAFKADFRAFADAPGSASISTTSMSAFFKVLPGLIRQWHNDTKITLRKMVVKDLQVALCPYTDLLGLAVVTFDCVQCWKTLRYPAVLVHLCTRSLHWKPDSASDAYTDAVNKFWCYRYQQWTTAPLDFRHALDRVRPIMEAFGQPLNTAAEDMDRLDKRVVYVSPTEPHIRKVMTWRRAFAFQPANIITTWELASEAGCMEAKDAERLASDELEEWSKEQNHWCCALCDDMFAMAPCSWRSMKMHHQASHQVNVAMGNVHLHPDCALLDPLPVTLNSEDS